MTTMAAQKCCAPTSFKHNSQLINVLIKIVLRHITNNTATIFFHADDDKTDDSEEIAITKLFFF